MNYEDWRKTQIDDYGQVVKPLHYTLGQYKTLKYFSDFIDGSVCLDVGCGTGQGMLGMYMLGALEVTGVDINPHKIEIARKLGLDAVLGDEFVLEETLSFDFIWCSHTLEHVYDPDKTIDQLRFMLYENAVLGLVVPYPDTGTPLAHVSSEKLGLRVEDNGATFLKWIEDTGFFKVIFHRFDNYREPELWVACKAI